MEETAPSLMSTGEIPFHVNIWIFYRIFPQKTAGNTPEHIPSTLVVFVSTVQFVFTTVLKTNCR